MAHALAGAKAAAALAPLASDALILCASHAPQNVGARQVWQGGGGSVKHLSQGGSYAQATKQSPLRGAQVQNKIGAATAGAYEGKGHMPAGQGRLDQGHIGSFAAASVTGGRGTYSSESRGSKLRAMPEATAVTMVPKKPLRTRPTAAYGSERSALGGSIAPRLQTGRLHASPVRVVALHTPLGKSRNASKRLDLEDVSAFPKLANVASKRVVAARAAKGKKAPGGKTEEEAGPLKRGVMIEFERDGGGGTKIHHIGVLQRPDGKKNWMVTDQLGNNHSIRPQQVTFLVPPKANQDPYSAADIQPLIEKADQAAAETDLLELAWESLIAEEGASLDARGMAQLLFTQASAVECLSAHRLLAADKTFFKPTKRKGADDLWALFYEPRPEHVVSDIKRQLRLEEERKALMSEYAQAAIQAAGAPRGEKPSQTVWEQNENFALRTAAIKQFAMDKIEENSDRRLAFETLDAIGCPKNPAVAFELLVRMGIFQEHQSQEMMTGAIKEAFPREVQEEAERRATSNDHPDAHEGTRADLRHLKVYMIDSDDTQEVDDGVSVEILSDGRKRLWVHVADPSRWVAPGDLLDYEARLRGTSAYLPTGAVPMFPIVLAAGNMSLQQGTDCTAMSVGVILRQDGSIEEKAVVASRVRPTYRLSYEEVDEMLQLGLDEEPELRTLLEEANRRHEYRYEQHAVEIKMPDYDIRATALDSEEPKVTIKLINERAPSRRLVEEMMIMAGEAVASWGGEYSIPLPYRGQDEPVLPNYDVLDQVPRGYCQSVLIRRCMTRGKISCRGPIHHSSLGLSGYVQFSSPIRRYGDLLAHYQVKAFLRGETPPFSADELASMTSNIEAQAREVKRLTRLSERYWMLEWFRQQPKHATWRALVLKYLKEDDLLALILVYDLGLELPVRLQRQVRVGTDLHIRVVRVNVRQDVLELAETYQPQEADSSLSTQLGEAPAEEADTSFDKEAGYSASAEEAGTSNGAHGSEENIEDRGIVGQHQNGVSGLRSSVVDEERNSERILVRDAGT